MNDQGDVVSTPLPGRSGAVARTSCTVGLALALLFIAPTAHAATVKVAPYGTTKDGRAVTAFTLTNDKGASATILDYGGTVAAIRVPDREGKLGIVVMSFAEMSGRELLGYANSIIGRVANRITNGFTLDGVYYPLQQTGPQGMTMHSGPQGYGTRIWTVAPIKPSDGASIKLS